MPSPSTEIFGTPAWFKRIPFPLPSHVPDHPSFAVEHRAITPQDATVVHQQLFSADELVGWIPRRVISTPDLTLIRTVDCDAGDLLGRLTAAEIINNTTVIIGQDHQTCPLGIANISRPGLDEVTAGTVDVALEVPATPFGDAELAIRLSSDGSQHLINRSEADADVTLRLPWPCLIDWLHTDALLGHFFNRDDVRIDGSISKLTYIGGHLTWPRTPQDQQRSQEFKKAMDTYLQLRQTPAYLELMDQIEEATS